VGLAVATTDVEEDIDGGPPRGRYRRVQQWPPLRLKMMSMVAPLGDATSGSSSSHH
jgi:hypothetical protein